MEEKKLTDEELLGEFEHFVKYGLCRGKITLVDILDLIHRLQENNANQVRMRCDMQRKFDDLQTLCTEQKAENKTLKKDYIELDLEARELRTELDNISQTLAKELAEHEEFTKKAKTEIESLKCDSYRTSWKAKFLEAKAEVERLTKERDVAGYKNNSLIFDKSELEAKNKAFQKQVEAWAARSRELEIAWEQSSSNEEKLQKQVDELTAFKNEAISMSLYGKGRKDGEEVAVKDTAKEILQELWDETEPLNESHKWVRLRIKNIASRKGVEVE
jgi:chromosome segregation ATPase